MEFRTQQGEVAPCHIEIMVNINLHEPLLHTFGRVKVAVVACRGGGGLVLVEGVVDMFGSVELAVVTVGSWRQTR